MSHQQVDEFGRAIQDGEGLGQPPVSSYASFSAPGTPSSNVIGNGGASFGNTASASAHEHYDPLPSRGPRHGGPPSTYQPHHTNNTNSHHHPNNSYERHGHGGHHHHHGGAGGGGWRNNDRRNNSNNSISSGGPRRSKPGHQPQPGEGSSVLPHPSERYVTEPMLCEFLWKEQQDEKGQAQTDTKSAAEDVTSTEDAAETVVKEEDTETANEPTDKDTDDTDNAASTSSSYDQYRTDYGWNFLKHFFNQHLDDSWFRQAYSPALLVQQAKLERTRANQEAKMLQQELTRSSKDGTLPSLVSLTKQSSHDSNSSLTPPTAHVFGTTQTPATLHFPHVPSHVTDEQITAALVPYLTEFFLQQAAAGSAAPPKKSSMSPAQVIEKGIVGLFSSTPHNAHTMTTTTLTGGGSASTTPNNHYSKKARGGSSSSSTPPSMYLQRSVFCVCTSAEVCEGVWQGLVQQRTNSHNSNMNNANNNTNLPHGNNDAHVPRKHHGGPGGMVELEVDCTDPYGRTEYDANGRGGAPPDGLAIPPRKATVAVQRYTQVADTVHTLSVALSSPLRFATDVEAAATIAAALDARFQVPEEYRLAALWEQLRSTWDQEAEEDEKLRLSLQLDIAVAYLRRVHLYSFYKATKATCWADLLTGRSPAGQIHLRDYNVELSTPEEEADLVKDDLLGQRLNDQIAKVLSEDVAEWKAAAEYVVDEATDAAAREISEAEERATEQWLANHSMDDDGRARCSFHFCHKLFKDDSFLKKHLMKKHIAYNQAERAKCHDAHMMAKWEKSASRPMVPQILVDCGKQFGKVESTLSGGPEPKAVDPEPDLWERKQQADKLRMERSELRAARNNPNYERQHASGGEDGMSSPRPSKRTFVDVDDMKDETVVEVSFDDVKIPVVTSKKKKKKRKLL